MSFLSSAASYLAPLIPGALEAGIPLLANAIKSGVQGITTSLFGGSDNATEQILASNRAKAGTGVPLQMLPTDEGGAVGDLKSISSDVLGYVKGALSSVLGDLKQSVPWGGIANSIVSSLFQNGIPGGPFSPYGYGNQVTYGQDLGIVQRDLYQPASTGITPGYSGYVPQAPGTMSQLQGPGFQGIQGESIGFGDPRFDSTQQPFSHNSTPWPVYTTPTRVDLTNRMQFGGSLPTNGIPSQQFQQFADNPLKSATQIASSSGGTLGAGRGELAVPNPYTSGRPQFEGEGLLGNSVFTNGRGLFSPF